jgi:hypothetical protein
MATGFRCVANHIVTDRHSPACAGPVHCDELNYGSSVGIAGPEKHGAMTCRLFIQCGKRVTARTGSLIAVSGTDVTGQYGRQSGLFEIFNETLLIKFSFNLCSIKLPHRESAGRRDFRIRLSVALCTLHCSVSNTGDEHVLLTHAVLTF